MSERLRKVTVRAVPDIVIQAMNLRARTMDVSRETLLLSLWKIEFAREIEAIRAVRREMIDDAS